jgi:alanyl-tRNA synthetase
MGFERLLSAAQNMRYNYDIDEFISILENAGSDLCSRISGDYFTGRREDSTQEHGTEKSQCGRAPCHWMTVNLWDLLTIPTMLNSTARLLAQKSEISRTG